MKNVKQQIHIYLLILGKKPICESKGQECPVYIVIRVIYFAGANFLTGKEKRVTSHTELFMGQIKGFG